MSGGTYGKASLPQLKCPCGLFHYEDEELTRPMGTLSLKKVIEQSKLSKSAQKFPQYNLDPKKHHARSVTNMK